MLENYGGDYRKQEESLAFWTILLLLIAPLSKNRRIMRIAPTSLVANQPMSPPHINKTKNFINKLKHMLEATLKSRRQYVYNLHLFVKIYFKLDTKIKIQAYITMYDKAM